MPERTPPLVVDLDGTLTRTDTLLEAILKVVKRSPLDLFRLPLWLLRGRARFKECIASRIEVEAASLPYRQGLLEFLRGEKARGRPIVLATAAHESIADAVAAHLGLFDKVLATRGGHNLKGINKLQAIQESVGPEFVYAGDSRADLSIWRGASAAILVGVTPRVAATVRRDIPVEREFPLDSGGIRTWVKAIRVHQWIKNLLLFVPLLTAFSFHDLEKVATMLLAFVAFSFTASSMYLMNDLMDIESDRSHPRKHLRPFASGQISIMSGISVAGLLLLTALLLGLVVSSAFLAILLLYILLTSAYSWVLKEYVLMDVLMLSVLYTLRILAGSIAVGIATSSWLFAFSVFAFLSLALVKRCAELVALRDAGEDKTHGRDYRVTDLTVLWPLGLSAALASVVVFGLFISAPETQERYLAPDLLWLVSFGLIYWLARLWVKTARGEMHDDPVVYAIRDRGSRVVVIAMVAVILLARFVTWGGWP